MEFHSLLTHHQPQTNLCVCQSFNATQRYLRLAAAQVFVLNYSLDNSLESAAADRAINSLRIRLHPPLFASRNHLLRRENAVSGSVIARSVSIGLNFAFDTELRRQSLEASSDGAQTDDTG